MSYFTLLVTCLSTLALCGNTPPKLSPGEPSTSPLTTKKQLEELRKSVTWEVAEYKESVFSGWSQEEFKDLLGDSAKLAKTHHGLIEEYERPNMDDLPDEIDWTNSSCTHGIRHQGKCGSCWAFAAADMVADRCCMQFTDRGWLSPQELISCDAFNSGCIGGLAFTALKYIRKNGLVPESCYSYTAMSEVCPTTCTQNTSRLSWAESHVCKCEKMINCSGLDGMRGCLKNGPIAVRMRVYSDFGFYKSGIYCISQYGTYLGGHAIRCIGYSSTPYPHLKCANSWGENWGMNGYFNIKATEKCGLRLTRGDAWAVSGCQSYYTRYVVIIIANMLFIEIEVITHVSHHGRYQSGSCYFLTLYIIRLFS
eukprot:TRINITY_DN37_c0_g1_i1.p2 TRINITY_DN37_c0_g1~~TRINITY_DN37_c0_g1_i1.p2  ORF type:complete len:366 (-),score=-7.77 TRINITY_DN37_c0_g1_i1:1085-2182(-)